MLENARLTPGRGFRPGRSFLYYSMRLLPQATPRRMLARGLAACVEWMHPAKSTQATVPSVPIHRTANTIDELRAKGCAVIEPLLSAAQVAETREFLRDKELVLPGGRRGPLDALPIDVRRAAYPLETVLGARHLVDMMNRSDVLAIASGYLGCRPTISGIGLHWSLPAPQGRSDVQRFHRDPDDWRFLKLFVYLTDVGDRSGPHEYVLGSHGHSGRVLSVPYEDAEVEKRYGTGSVLRVLGPAGTMFMADTWGIHKGRVAENEPRLMFQVTYSILPIYKFLYYPIAAPEGLSVDPYTNRLLFARR